MNKTSKPERESRIKVQAPWAMKRMESNAGGIIVTDEKPTVIPDKTKQPEPPLAKTDVTDKFQSGFSHPYSMFVKYECPLCAKSYRIALNNIPSSGHRSFRCECGEDITLDLAFATN